MENDLKTRIGRVVSRARSRAGFSLDALAAEIQAAGLPISASKLASIEGGQILPNSECAQALEGVLGIDLHGFDLPPPKTHVLPEPPARDPPRTTSAPAAAPEAPEPRNRASDEALSPPPPTRTKVGEYPRVTLYLAPEVKNLLDGASSVLGIPAYRILTTAFLDHLETLPEAERTLIQRVAERRSGRTKSGEVVP